MCWGKECPSRCLLLLCCHIDFIACVPVVGGPYVPPACLFRLCLMIPAALGRGTCTGDACVSIRVLYTPGSAVSGSRVPGSCLLCCFAWGCVVLGVALLCKVAFEPLCRVHVWPVCHLGAICLVCASLLGKPQTFFVWLSRVSGVSLCVSSSKLVLMNTPNRQPPCCLAGESCCCWPGKARPV
jgi:hypothetical protein